MSIAERHIGDGVYVSDDGYQIWLAANNHMNKVVALEPRVFRELLTAAAELYDAETYAKMLRELADKIDEMKVPKEPT